MTILWIYNGYIITVLFITDITVPYICNGYNVTVDLWFITDMLSPQVYNEYNITAGP
jgi:hypothetical protein